MVDVQIIPNEHMQDLTSLGPLHPLMCDAIIRCMNMNDNGIKWQMSEPPSDDDHEPLFKSAPAIGG